MRNHQGFYNHLDKKFLVSTPLPVAVGIFQKRQIYSATLAGTMHSRSFIFETTTTVDCVVWFVDLAMSVVWFNRPNARTFVLCWAPSMLYGLSATSKGIGSCGGQTWDRVDDENNTRCGIVWNLKETGTEECDTIPCKLTHFKYAGNAVLLATSTVAICFRGDTRVYSNSNILDTLLAKCVV